MSTYTITASPVGPLTLESDDHDRLSRLAFADERRAGSSVTDADDVAPRGVVAEAVRQLDAYFAGRRHEFDLTLAPRGTEFQLAVWNALRAIPYGETTSYGAIARSVGRPNAVRAVGQANGRNPIAIVVPCHRVIGSDRSLTGFGGGLHNKRFLLGLEGSMLTPAFDL